MDFVIDASMAAAWVIADERTQRLTRLLDQLENRRGYVPDMFWHEMRNILLIVERRGRICKGSAEPAMHKLRATSDHRAMQRSDESFALARRPTG